MLFRAVPGNGTQKAILGQQGIAIPRATALDEASLIKHVLGEDVNRGLWRVLPMEVDFSERVGRRGRHRIHPL